MRAQQIELAFGAQVHIQGLRFIGQVGQVQRQTRLIAARQKARCGQLGDQWRCDHGFGLGHAIAVIGPGLRHQTQFAVKVRNVDTDFAFALLIEGDRRALQRHDGDAGRGPLAAFGQRRIATKRQTGQTPLPGFDQLPINIQLVRTIGLAAKQARVRIRCGVIRDIEHANIDRGEQYMGLFGHTAIRIFSVNFHRQWLLGAHLFWRVQGQRQLALRAIQRQMQHADSTFGGDVGFALTGANHQRADVQVVTRPTWIKFDVEGFTFARHFNFLPPQWAIAALDQQIPLARCGRRDGHFGRFAIGVSRFIERQLDLIGPHCAAFGVVLGTITGPEAQAADQPGFWVFNLYAIRPPLHREADLGGCAGLEADGFFIEVQKLLVVVIAPAIVIRVVPVVIAALADQSHLEVFSGQFVALVVRYQHFKFCRAIAIGFSAIKQTADARQAIRWPYRLHQTAGDRAPTGLLQTGLHDQLQGRLGIAPRAFKADGLFALSVQNAFVQLQILGQFFFRHRAKLIPRQGFDRLTQRAHIHLTTQAITRRWSTV